MDIEIVDWGRVRAVASVERGRRRRVRRGMFGCILRCGCSRY